MSGRLSFVQDSRHQPRAPNQKHDMTSSVGFSQCFRRRKVDTTNSESIANLESYAAFSVKSKGYWNEVGTRCSASVGILGHLGLHMLHPERVSQSYHSRGRAAVRGVQFCRTVAVLDNLVRGSVRRAMLQKVAMDLLLV